MATAPTRLFDLYSLLLKSPSDILQYYQDKGLVGFHYTCPNCNVNMKLSVRKELSDGYGWRCTKCKCRRSIRKGTWFESSHLSLGNVLILIYMWVHRISQELAMHELSIGSSHTVHDWYNFCRDVCREVVLKHSQHIIGGSGVVVEVDEIKFSKLKYNKDNHVENKWVFGGVECGTNRCFLRIIEDRTPDTFFFFIKEHIAPGTTIISNCWKAYANLNKEHFDNLRLNSITFKDPETGVHSNTLQAVWSGLKRSFYNAHYSTGTFDWYSSEFMYRRIHKDVPDLFLQFLSDIIKVYPPATFDTSSSVATPP